MLGIPSWAQNQAQLRPSHEELMESIRAAQHTPSVGESAFIELSRILPGQRRYSLENVWKHIREYMDEYKLKFRDGAWRLPDPVSGALLPLDEALPVVVTSRGMVLLDGHHHVLACLAVGCRQVPIRVVHDISTLSRTEQARELRRYANYSGLDGVWRQIDSFTEMVDDPMLMVVRAARLRLEMRDNGRIRQNGIERPAWITFRGDHFPEIRVADALRRSGYKPPKGFNGELSSGEIEKIRDVLLRYVANNPSRIPGVEVVSREALENGIDGRAVFLRHLAHIQRNPCIANYNRITELLAD